VISKNQIKFLHSLLLKKNRLKHQKVILEGQRLIEESMRAGANIEYLCLTENFKNKISSNNLLNQIESYKISNSDLKKVTDTKVSQGIIALVNTKKYHKMNFDSIQNNNFVVLDGIQDPGNMGTILRTCIWFGIDSIILTSNCCDPFNLKCIRSGVGAHFYFKNIIIAKSNLVYDYLIEKKYDILVADLNGNNISNYNKKNNWALILGSEPHGISDTFKNLFKITIPKIGKIESLNVSVAAGIILNEIIDK